MILSLANMKSRDVIHAGKPEPHNEVPQAQSAHNNFWDFQFLHQEATHMFHWAMSDRAIPRSYRYETNSPLFGSLTDSG